MTAATLAALLPVSHARHSGRPGSIGALYSAKTKQFTSLLLYDNLCDFMLANPTSTLAERAAYVNRSYAWTSLVCGSDSFRAHYEARRAGLNQELTAAVQTRLVGVAAKSLDILLERLDDRRDVLPIMDALEVSDRALARLGYGQKAQSGGTIVNVQQNAAPTLTREELEIARRDLREVEIHRASGGPGVAGGGGSVL